MIRRVYVEAGWSKAFLGTCGRDRKSVSLATLLQRNSIRFCLFFVPFCVVGRIGSKLVFTVCSTLRRAVITDSSLFTIYIIDFNSFAAGVVSK